METLAIKRQRIKVQRKRANAIKELVNQLQAGYAAGVHVRKGEVIFRCAKAPRQGLKIVWGELGVIGIEIHGDAGREILGDAAVNALMNGVGAA